MLHYCCLLCYQLLCTRLATAYNKGRSISFIFTIILLFYLYVMGCRRQQWTPIVAGKRAWIWLNIEVDIKQLNSYKGSGGNKKLPTRRFPTVGIVQEFCQTTTQLPPQTSSPWCSVCPPYSVDSMNCPNPTRGRLSEGVGRGRLRWVLCKSIK